MPTRCSGRRALLLGGLAVLLVATQAQAARYHVAPGGQRTSGPSIPGDWDLANVYATVAGAAQACADGDSILLSADLHPVTTTVDLPSLLGNRSLSEDPAQTVLDLAPPGRLRAAGRAATAVVQGVSLSGDQQPRATAALEVAQSAGLPGLVSLIGCRLEGFHEAGAVRVFSATEPLQLQARDTVFRDNTDLGRGGAVQVETGIAALFLGCDFVANASLGVSSRGGAVSVEAAEVPSSVTFVDCEFLDNRCDGPGGTVFVQNGGAAFENCDLRGSRSGLNSTWAEGAGVFVRRYLGHTDTLSVTVNDCRFVDNRGSLELNTHAGDGGAFMVKGDADRYMQVTVSDCLFERNFNAQGAGLYVGRFAFGTVKRCAFLANTSYYQGGGSMKGGALDANIGETVTYRYCLFQDNRAGYRDDGTETGEYSRGGGVMVRRNPRAVLENCTFLDNTVNTYSYRQGDGFAHSAEGGPFAPDSRCSLYNCAFWGAGNHVQLYSGADGLDVLSHCAVEEDQYSAAGVAPEAMVWLSGFPFAAAGTALPAAGGALVDVGLDLGFTEDLARRSVPVGPLPEIGCYEFHGPAVGAPEQLPAVAEVAAWPNPFNPRTTVACRLQRAGFAELSLVDASGRLVRRLHHGWLAAGRHRWVWDGVDQAGRPLASGLYLAVLRVDGERGAVTKLTLVR